MTDAIITTVISSICVLLGSVITVIVTNNKNKAVAKIEQEYIKQELSELKSRVDEHNNYAVEIPLIKQDINFIKENMKC